MAVFQMIEWRVRFAEPALRTSYRGLAEPLNRVRRPGSAERTRHSKLQHEPIRHDLGIDVAVQCGQRAIDRAERAHAPLAVEGS